MELNADHAKAGHIAERGLTKTALLKDESFSRGLRCLHEAEQTLTASTQLLDTLEKRAALTAIVADLETLQRRLCGLIEFRGMDDKPIIPPRPFG